MKWWTVFKMPTCNVPADECQHLSSLDFWLCMMSGLFVRLGHWIFSPLGMYPLPSGMYRTVNDRGEEKPCQVAFSWFFCHIWHNLSNWHSPCLRFVTCNLRKYLHKRCLRCRNAVFSISSTYPCSLVRNLLILSDYIIQLPLVTDSRRKEYSKCILCPWAPFHFNFYLQFNLYLVESVAQT